MGPPARLAGLVGAHARADILLRIPRLSQTSVVNDVAAVGAWGGASVGKTYRNFIDGAWCAAAAAATFENRNPADVRDRIGAFPASGPEDVRLAVASAVQGFRAWSAVPAPQRGDIIRRMGDLLSDQKEAIADGMTREMGKPLEETRGDVQEAIDTAYYAAGEGRRLF